MVEHSLQGEDTSLSVIDFIASGRTYLPLYDLNLILYLQIKLLSIFPGRRSGTSSLRSVSMTAVKQSSLVGCQEAGR